MSKLYQTYAALKMQNSSQLYLFKSGIFYIFLDEDAKLISTKFNLKLTNLNSMLLLKLKNILIYLILQIYLLK